MAPHAPVHNITVPYVSVADFDWSFARSGPLPWNQTVWAILAVFTALPLWTTVELTAWIFYIFRRYKGLYFWSVLACTWGVSLHAIGFVLKFCVPSCNWIVATILAEIGWVGMVTGFSVVLYSRLKLIVRSHNVRKWVLIMIVADAFLFHVPTIVFQFGVSNKPTHKKYLPYMAPMERVQVMGFSIQEIIISTLYIYHTRQYLRDSFHKTTRKTIALLIGVQVIVILADVIVVTLDYCEYFTLKAVLHSFVYAFKLQLEFVILNDIKEMASKGGLSGSGNLGQPRFESHDSTRSTPMGSPAGKPSGKRWWSSKLNILPTPSETSTPSMASNEVVIHAAHVDVHYVGARSASVETMEERKNSGSMQKSPEMPTFITAHFPGEVAEREEDVERQYLGNAF